MLLSVLNLISSSQSDCSLLTVQLAADPDPNVKNGAELLDRLIKVSNRTVSLFNSRELSLLHVHVMYKITGIKNYWYPEFHHFHIDHNAPCFPPKFCITVVSNFSWVLQSSQEKSKTMVTQKFGG